MANEVGAPQLVDACRFNGSRVPALETVWKSRLDAAGFPDHFKLISEKHSTYSGRCEAIALKCGTIEPYTLTYVCRFRFSEL